MTATPTSLSLLPLLVLVLQRHLMFLLMLQHAPKTRGEAMRFLELLFGSPPHPQPLIRAQRTFAVFLMKDLLLLKLQHQQQQRRAQQRLQQGQQQRQLHQQEQKQQEIRKLLRQRGFYILWEKEVHLNKETVVLLCQVRHTSTCFWCCWWCSFFCCCGQMTVHVGASCPAGVAGQARLPVPYRFH